MTKVGSRNYGLDGVMDYVTKVGGGITGVTCDLQGHRKEVLGNHSNFHVSHASKVSHLKVPHTHVCVQKCHTVEDRIGCGSMQLLNLGHIAFWWFGTFGTHNPVHMRSQISTI